MGMYKGYIYRHWIVNDKGVEKNYIGQVYNRTPEERWNDGKGYKKYKFGRAIKKYGWDNFNHKVLFSIECETLDELVFWLDEWEKYYIEKYDSFYNGYNSSLGGRGCKGYKHTDASKKKIKDGRTGMKFTDEHKKHLSVTKKQKFASGEIKPYNLGQKMSEEQKRKLSEAKKGKKLSEEHKKHLGKKVICITTGEIFDTLAEAGEKYGIKGNISKCCRGIVKHAGRHPETGEQLQWMFYEDYLKQVA